MQTEISAYDATGYREALTRLALQRANIMHLVDLKRGGYSPRRTELRIGRSTARPQSFRSYQKVHTSFLTFPRRALPVGPSQNLG
jgi:hypothetical protein